MTCMYVVFQRIRKFASLHARCVSFFRSLRVFEFGTLKGWSMFFCARLASLIMHATALNDGILYRLLCDIIAKMDQNTKYVPRKV